METTTIRSAVHPTAELAGANVGMPDAIAGKGKSARITKTDVVEVEGGFVAIAYVQIEELEGAEELPVAEETTQAGSGESEGGMASGAGYIAALQPSRIFPATNQPPVDLEAPQLPDEASLSEMADRAYEEEQARALEDTPQSDTLLGPDTLTDKADDLSEMLQNDFEAAEKSDATLDPATIQPNYYEAPATPEDANLPPRPTGEEALSEEEWLKRQNEHNNDLQLDLE